MSAADGIYFGMPEDTYHSLQRLSASGIKRLRISAATFWADSWLNPNPRELTEDQKARMANAKLIGRAYHCARLEPDAFHDRYCRQIDKADFDGVKGFLSSSTEYGEALAEIGEAKKKAGEGVEAQAERLAATGYPGPIWHIERAKWEAERAGRAAVPAIVWDEILQDMERIRKLEPVHALLAGGEPEVTILWTCPATGLPMKTRLDYLRPDSWSDFKTFANANGKPVQQAITDSFKFSRYHLQAVIQREAVEGVRLGAIPLMQAATDGQRALFEAIRARPGELDCHYIWQEKGGIPNIWARRLKFFAVPWSVVVNHPGASEEGIARVEAAAREPTRWFTRARREVAAAKRDFTVYSEIYAPGDEWLPFQPCGDLDDLDFNDFWLDEAI